MSTGVEPRPQPPSAPPPDAPLPETPPARGGWREWWRLRRQATELRYALAFRGVQRTRVITQVLLLHFRYTCGLLATGFLVSAPIQLGTTRQWDEIWRSVLLGVVLGIPFLVLAPLTNIDWGRMRLPEFKNLELAFTRWAVWASLLFFVVGLLSDWMSLGWVLDAQVTWVNLVLMLFAWVRVKVHMVMFREFYTLRPGDDLVVSLPLGYETRHPAPPGEKDRSGAAARDQKAPEGGADMSSSSSSSSSS